MRYIRFGIMNLLLLANLSALLAGSIWPWVSFFGVVLLSSPVDEVAGDDLAAPAPAPERVLLGLLYLTLPLLALNCFVFAHYFTLGDPTGLVRWLGTIGIPFESARIHTSWWMVAGAFMGIGIYIGAAGTNVAHELVHRTGSAMSLLIGRWLLAFSFDTTFSIEHVYGHHKHVATPQDPASAKRGENVFRFAVRSFVQGNISGFRIEADRLRRRGLSLFGFANRAITGQFMSLFILAVFYWIGGWAGVLACIVVGLQGKFYLELVNYIEHYGLVRVPGTRVEARHSWNCYRSISGAILYNLPRHSHHHSFAAKPFWSLEVDEDGPVLPYGYMSMILLALVPPLFKAKMQPLLEHWDTTYANSAEKKILAESYISTLAAE